VRRGIERGETCAGDGAVEMGMGRCEWGLTFDSSYIRYSVYSRLYSRLIALIPFELV